MIWLGCVFRLRNRSHEWERDAVLRLKWKPDAGTQCGRACGQRWSLMFQSQSTPNYCPMIGKSVRKLCLRLSTAKTKGDGIKWVIAIDKGQSKEEKKSFMLWHYIQYKGTCYACAFILFLFLFYICKRDSLSIHQNILFNIQAMLG